MALHEIRTWAGRKLIAAGRYVLEPGALSARLRWPVFNWDIYEAVSRIRTLEPDLKTVLDVGADRGMFSLAALEAFSEAAVHAFEPLAESRIALAGLARRFGEGRLTVWPVALGRHAGSRPLHVSAHAPSSSLLPMMPAHESAFPGTEVVSSRDVDVVTLDSAMARVEIRRPALLKLDVQGFELEVLRGGAQAMRCIDLVLVEVSFDELYRGAPRFDEIHDCLAESGFAFRGSIAPARNRNPVQMDALYQRRVVRSGKGSESEALVQAWAG